VSGRWQYNLEIKTRRDQIVYYCKLAVGTPIPWLLFAFAASLSLSRAALEIASWSLAVLTSAYIFADRYAENREFRFFRIGSDLLLLGFLLSGLVTAATCSSFGDAISTIGEWRWVVLLYALAYCWQLFPGMNRIFYALLAVATAVCGYAVWQHFAGIDLLTGQTLVDAPTRVYFLPTALFGSTEVLGTLAAIALPLLASAFVLRDRRDNRVESAIILGASLVLTAALFWTYRPGLWIAGSLGVIVAFLVKARQITVYVGSLAALVAFILFAFYSSPSKMFDRLHEVETKRSAQQREQINAEVVIWQDHPWFGAGVEAVHTTERAKYDPNLGNVYFMILAQAGAFGALFYLLFILSSMLATYRIFNEIPPTHHWHRVLVAGGLGAQVAFHVAGLYWNTLAEAVTLNLYVFILASIAYLTQRYESGIVSDDSSL
jgi:hypothetical protein